MFRNKGNTFRKIQFEELYKLEVRSFMIMKNKPLINAHQTLMLLKDLNFHEINNKNKIALISHFFNSML